jgi:hypothetical protein
METHPIILPDLQISATLTDLVQRYCPISQMEIVDEGDEDNRIYKYVGLCEQPEVSGGTPSHYKLRYFRRDVVSLYECVKENACVFWHENVLVIMISNTEDQHEGVMTHYEDAAALLTQIGCDLVCQIRIKTKGIN